MFNLLHVDIRFASTAQHDVTIRKLQPQQSHNILVLQEENNLLPLIHTFYVRQLHSELPKFQYS